MPYTRKGRSLANENIAVALPQSNTEKIIIGSSDGTPAEPLEDVTIGNLQPVGAEKIAIGVTGPNPEIP